MKINLKQLQEQAEKQALVSDILSLPRVDAPGRYILEPYTAVDRTDVPDGRTPLITLVFKVVGVDESYQWWKTPAEHKAAVEQVGKYFIDNMYLSQKSIGRAALFTRVAEIDVELQPDEEGNVDYYDALNAYATAITEAFESGKVPLLVGIVQEQTRTRQDFDEETGDFVEVTVTEMNTPYNAYRKVSQ